MDTSELGRCQARIKSRRPVLGVRRAANQLQATTLQVGHDLSEPTLRTVAPMLTLSVLSIALGIGQPLAKAALQSGRAEMLHDKAPLWYLRARARPYKT